MRKVFIKNLLFFSCVVYTCTLRLNAQDFVVVPADKPAYEKKRMGIVYTLKKSRSDWFYELQGGYITRSKYKEKSHTYDIEGRFHETTFLSSKGVKKGIVLYTYRSDNLPLEMNEYSPHGNQLSRVSYVYDEGGRLKEVIEYKGKSKVTAKTVFHVNDSLKTVSERRYYSPDSIVYRKVSHYTNLDSGYIFRVEEFDGEYQFRFAFTIKRDEGMRIEEEKYFNINGDLMYFLKYNYNPKGKLANKEKISMTGHRIKTAEYHYTSLKLLSGEILYNHLGEIIKYYKYSYD